MRFVSLPLLVALAAPLGAVPSDASAVNCRVAHGLRLAIRDELLKKSNPLLPHEERLTRRKTLFLFRFTKFEMRGCDVTFTAVVKLRRTRRRDATGTMTATGRVTSLDARNLRMCVGRLRVTRVRLSRTSRVTEALYRKVANRRIKGAFCGAARRS